MLSPRQIALVLAPLVACTLTESTRPLRAADTPPGFLAWAGFDFPRYQANTSIVGYGVGEPGWAGPWTGVGNETGSNAIAQHDVKFEGNLALHITPTDRVQRVLSQPQSGRFVVEQFVRLSVAGQMIQRIENAEGQGGFNEEANIGPQWMASAMDGRIYVLNGDGAQGGSVEFTGFHYTPDTWHHVAVVVDVPSNTWEFYFDGQKYQEATPLGFRGTLFSLDTVQYLSEVSVACYVDSVLVWKAAP
jgi:hypothetical protein